MKQISYGGENIRQRGIHSVWLHLHKVKIKQNPFVMLDVRKAVVTLRKVVCVRISGISGTFPQCVEYSIS